MARKAKKYFQKRVLKSIWMAIVVTVVITGFFYLAPIMAPGGNIFFR